MILVLFAFISFASLRKHIQEALNQQTYSQFKAYAEQQYRDNRLAVRRINRMKSIDDFVYFSKKN